MKRLIVLSAVVVMGALGLACGDTAANNANKTNANANRVPPIANNTSVGNAANTVSNTLGNAVNTIANAVKPANSNTNKPANANVKANANSKKP
ncbi:MAG: hypothetical protein ABJB40_01765 [Acidobacteriota bacterium]